MPGGRASDLEKGDACLKKDSSCYLRRLLAETWTMATRVVSSWPRLYDRVCAGNQKRKGKARIAVMHEMI